MEQSNIKQESNLARAGMNLDLSVNQIPKGTLSYALNGTLENFDANSISYQNEPGNELCLKFPEGYVLIGKHFINEQNKHIFFLVNPDTEQSEIGYMENNDCIYRTYINAPCLNFNINHPIHKVVHKITNCSTEIYWPDNNGRRFLDLSNIPYKIEEGADICDNVTTTEIDCNKLKVQTNFKIPSIEVLEVINTGNLVAGTVQFGIQYADVEGNAYTSYYSITNPLPIADVDIVTADFNYPVGKSVVIDISNIDTTGYFQYFNLAVIKTVNAITSVELIGTYFIDSPTRKITYNGQNQTQVKLTIDDIFDTFPYYDIADDVTSVQDLIVWKGLTSIDRINYQQIANKISLQWETWRIPATENYADEINAANLKGYLRDEIYPFEIQWLLTNGKETDGFHIPGRVKSIIETSQPDILSTDPDYIEIGTSAPYWKIYNTATVLGTDPAAGADDYKGPYQYGEFAYWESEETYPCNSDVWGELAGKPIRHHKFPDVLVSPIFESSPYTLGVTEPVMEKRAIYPIGVKVDVSQIRTLIATSNLTPSQKSEIVGFRILRGDRSTNKSIVAKGILRNVGKYNREGQDFYFPNYPYNDLQEDPFLLEKNNAYYQECNRYTIVATNNTIYTYTDCQTNIELKEHISAGETVSKCSLTTPVLTSEDDGTVTAVIFDVYTLTVTGQTFDRDFVDFLYTNVSGDEVVIKVEAGGVFRSRTKSVTVQVFLGTVPIKIAGDTDNYSIALVSNSQDTSCYPDHLSAFTSDESKYRHVFNSPETSFGQPYLGNILKLESAIFGGGKGHFVQVKNNALYKFITKEAQEKALKSSEDIAAIGTFSAAAMFTAYQAYLQIYLDGITRRNYGWSYNSIASYNYTAEINNGLGIKQRKLDIAQYLFPGVQSVGDNHNINNYNRESSVYLKTLGTSPLPYPSDTDSILVGGISAFTDRSRYINSQQDCVNPGKEFDIDVLSYYASIKNNIVNQWGEIYSYETIDTGSQTLFSENVSKITVFGGDTFICPFSFKTKLPFFIENRVNTPDDSDVFYDEIGNVAYPEFWHSSRSILYDYLAQGSTVMENIISIKAHKFDCSGTVVYLPQDTTSTTTSTSTTSTTTTVAPGAAEFSPEMYYDGKMYLFAYGIPIVYVESSINVDLRQAFNRKEGDFYPHVSTGIPDDWVQESFVPIVQDNTYYYNVTYSKQNKEKFFPHLPIDWTDQLCYTNFPFRAIYSERQQSFTDNRVNSWLIYRPDSYFDFPQNYGNFTSIDGIQNRAVLARFDNKSLLYNTLLTIDTSNPQAAYIGNDSLFRSSPPIDFAETDLGYVGSQHKFLLKIPHGQITVDAKRGQIFLISGNKAEDITKLGSGVNRFMTDHLSFEILRYFPTVDTDNHFNRVGLHGVFDSKFERIIITKLDYIPLSSDVKYDEVTKTFYVNRIYPQSEGEDLIVRETVYLTDTNYFCNKSWSISFNLNTMTWVSFHSYIPNWYIAEHNFFYSGLNESCEIEAIAATILDCTIEGTLLSCTIDGTVFLIEETTTTSTTTTEAPTTTTTSTTTTTALDCEIEGTAEQQ